MTHFDKVAALVHRSFNELSASISENFSGRKVIAGLVMKMAEHDIGTVISIGTGNINSIHVLVTVLTFLTELPKRLKVLLIYQLLYTFFLISDKQIKYYIVM